MELKTDRARLGGFLVAGAAVGFDRRVLVNGNVVEKDGHFRRLDLLGVVPARGADVFTRGALPGDEASLRAVLNSIAKRLDEAGLAAVEALRLAVEAGRAELSGRASTAAQ